MTPPTVTVLSDRTRRPHVAEALARIERDVRAVPLPARGTIRIGATRTAAAVEVVDHLVEAPGGTVVRLLRFRSGRPARAEGPVCLFVPGRFGTSAVYTDDECRDLRLFLAHRHGEVWSLEHRPTPAHPGRPGPVWRTADCVADIAACLAALAPRPVVLIGHSMGASLCYAAAMRWPDRVSGIIALDGGLVAATASLAAERTARELLESGAGGWEAMSGSPLGLGHLVARARQDDAGALRALGRLLALPSATREGCMLARTDDRELMRTVVAYLATLRPCWPRRQTLEARLLAVSGPGTWADNGLVALNAHGVRVFAALGAAGGAGRLAQHRYTAQRADPSAEVTVVDQYGHLDVLLGPGVHETVFEPAAAWLNGLGRSA